MLKRLPATCALVLLLVPLVGAAARAVAADAAPSSETLAPLDRPLAPTNAPDLEGWSPEPFQARYRARYDGVPFSAKGRRLLLRDEDGGLRFLSDLRAKMLLRISEEARVELGADGALRPLRYAYNQSGIGGRKERILDFDWKSGEVRRSGDKERVHAIERDYLDPVSWQLALRRDVSRGTLAVGDVLEYAITDGGAPKIYAIKVRGSERIELPGGDLEALKLERIFEPGDPRETRMWLAPEYDHVLVRLEAVDDSGRTLSLELLEPPEPS